MYHLMELVRGQAPRAVRAYKTIENARKALAQFGGRHFIQYSPDAIEKAASIGRHFQQYAQVFSSSITPARLAHLVAVRGGSMYHAPRAAYHDVPLALARGYLPKSTGGARHA